MGLTQKQTARAKRLCCQDLKGGFLQSKVAKLGSSSFLNNGHSQKVFWVFLRVRNAARSSRMFRKLFEAVWFFPKVSSFSSSLFTRGFVVLSSLFPFISPFRFLLLAASSKMYRHAMVVEEPWPSGCLSILSSVLITEINIHQMKCKLSGRPLKDFFSDGGNVGTQKWISCEVTLSFPFRTTLDELERLGNKIPSEMMLSKKNFGQGWN